MALGPMLGRTVSWAVFKNGDEISRHMYLELELNLSVANHLAQAPSTAKACTRHNCVFLGCKVLAPLCHRHYLGRRTRSAGFILCVCLQMFTTLSVRSILFSASQQRVHKSAT